MSVWPRRNIRRDGAEVMRDLPDALADRLEIREGQIVPRYVEDNDELETMRNVLRAAVVRWQEDCGCDDK